MSWRRGSQCYEGNCLEATELAGGSLVGFRDSKHPELVVMVSKEAWRNFTDGVKAGAFDDFTEGGDDSVLV